MERRDNSLGDGSQKLGEEWIKGQMEQGLYQDNRMVTSVSGMGERRKDGWRRGW